MHFCIKGLLKGKTIIMVTHQLSLLADFDVTAIVKDGRFDYCGPFNTDVLLVCAAFWFSRSQSCVDSCFALIVLLAGQLSQLCG
jgi:ABC-type uncharacterized transport system permease subunit